MLGRVRAPPRKFKKKFDTSRWPEKPFLIIFSSLFVQVYYLFFIGQNIYPCSTGAKLQPYDAISYESSFTTRQINQKIKIVKHQSAVLSTKSTGNEKNRSRVSCFNALAFTLRNLFSGRCPRNIQTLWQIRWIPKFYRFLDEHKETDAPAGIELIIYPSNYVLIVCHFVLCVLSIPIYVGMIKTCEIPSKNKIK